MKLVIQFLLSLCFLLFSGEGRSHVGTTRHIGANCLASVSTYGTDGQTFLSAPSQPQEEPHLLAIIDDCEDRDEEDDLFPDTESVTVVSHAARCTRPRAPGSDLRGNSASRFCKHFAWSSADRLVVIQVFRV